MLTFNAFREARPASFAGLSHHWSQVWSAWRDRRWQRRYLAALDERLLADIGLTREQSRVETAKPFWLP